jgi:hypothetical protein
MSALPTMNDLLLTAESRPSRRAMRNQVTFPIWKEAEIERLYKMFARRGVKTRRNRFSREGLQVSFESAGDAILAKMSFTDS